jgi:hypothetical protein
VLAVAWVAIALVLSLGAAGIVATMTSQPETDAHAELTYTGDASYEPAFANAMTELSKLSGEVAQLSDLGRAALGQLSAGDSDQLDATVAQGEELASTIESHAASIRHDLQTLPGLGPGDDLALSPGALDRERRALASLDSTNGLSAAWSKLAVSAGAASRIATLLSGHDQSTADAAADGRQEKYTDALAKLDESDRLMAQSRAFRDTLAKTVDVGTLTQWLDLNASYDAALRRLYQALVDSKGKVTNEVRAAFEGEGKARNQLPADSKALVIILAEIGRGGLNQAVITIEQARGELDSAIGTLNASESPGPDGSEAPVPSS